MRHRVCAALLAIVAAALPGPGRAQAPATDLTSPAAVVEGYLAAVRAGDVEAALGLLKPDPALANMVRMMQQSLTAQAAGGGDPWSFLQEIALLPMAPDSPLELVQGEEREGAIELTMQVNRPLRLVLAKLDDGTWRVDLRASLEATCGVGGSQLVRQAEMMANLPGEAAAMAQGQTVPYEVQSALQLVGSAIEAYAEEHDNKYPDADTWTEDLAPYLEGERPFGSPLKPDETYSYAFNAELSGAAVATDWNERQRTVLLVDLGEDEPNSVFFPDEIAAMEPRYGDSNVICNAATNALALPAGMSYADVWVAQDRSEATQDRMGKLIEAARKFAAEHDGLLPEADTWCDDLQPYLAQLAVDGGDPYISPGVEVEPGQVTFAICAELAGRPLEGMVNLRAKVLFVETEPVPRNTSVAADHTGPARHLNAWSPTAPRGFYRATLNGQAMISYPPLVAHAEPAAV